jgi:type II secretory pathway component PulM
MNITLLTSWWAQRTLQEKKVLKIGIYFVIVIVVYYALTLGLAKTMELAENKWNRNQALLDWMIPRVAFLKEQHAKQAVPIPDSELLSTLQKSINQSPLKTSLIEMYATPKPNVAVQIQLKGVNFNALLQWLGEQKTQNGVTVISLSAINTPQEGIVDVKLLLDNPLTYYQQYKS